MNIGRQLYKIVCFLQGTTPLHKAVKKADVQKVKILLEEGADINERNKEGQTPLIVALIWGHTDVAKLLIDKGVDVNIKAKGQTPLILALTKGYIDVAKLLIDKGADVNEKNNEGDTPLLVALVKLPIAKWGDVNTKDREGVSSLHDARIVEGYTEIIKLMLNKGADVDTKSKDGFTPLHTAIGVMGHTELVKVFIDVGANIEIKGPSPVGMTPLYGAVTLGRIEVVKTLVNAGADVNTKTDDGYGHTILMHASQVGNMEMVKILVDAGADVNAKNKSGHTALGIALMSSSQYPSTMLLQGRHQINHEEVINYLTEIGADPGPATLAEKSGDQPLENPAASHDLPSSSDSSEQPHFRNVRWGMTKEEVLAAEKITPVDNKKSILGYIIEFVGEKAFLHYHFQENKLVSAYIVSAERKDNKRFLQDYHNIKMFLTTEYGPPFQDKTVWRNDTYKADHSKWDIAVSLGHVQYYATWHARDTIIGLDLIGGYTPAHWLIQYYSEHYEIVDIDSPEAAMNVRQDLQEHVRTLADLHRNILNPDNIDELESLLASMSEVKDKAYTYRKALYILTMAELVFVKLLFPGDGIDLLPGYLNEIKNHAEYVKNVLKEAFNLMEYHVLVAMYMFQTGHVNDALQELKQYEEVVLPFNSPKDREYVTLMREYMGKRQYDEIQALFQQHMISMFNTHIDHLTNAIKRSTKRITQYLEVSKHHFVKEPDKGAKGEQSDRQKAQFRNVRWGMSQREVLASEKTKPLQKDHNTLAYTTEFAGKNVYLGYTFQDDKLVSAFYGVPMKHSDKNLCLQDYQDLKEFLTDQHGQPSEDKTIWHNERYKHDRSKWGLALSLGHVEYFTTWYTPETGIDLHLAGEQSKIICNVNYVGGQLLAMMFLEELQHQKSK